MTFTPWKPILAYGSAPPADGSPYAIFTVYFARYHPVWQAPAWRMDLATGEFEYRGLVKVADGQACPATSVHMVHFWMSDTRYPTMPKPNLQMFIGQTSYGGGLNEPTRMDVNPTTANTAGVHHTVVLEATSSTGTAIGAGNWFWLGNISFSCSNNNPIFGPWAGSNADTGQVCFGAYFNYYATGWRTYPGWMGAQFRCTPDYKRWQWRGLLQNLAGALVASTYTNVIDVAHPGPYGNSQVLNTAIGHTVWPGGQVGSMRLDAFPHTYGQGLRLVGAKATPNAYIALNLDYMIRT